ncbi:MAG TPA: YafY family protein [Roseiflexaceae bacterium]|nr:YafY family protein [Roseiflexaceae bacterium]
MYHPTTRVLTVLEMLQARPGLSGAELAARLEVDRRTVRRYITMLQDLGIPIEATRGPYGSYRLRPGFKLPPLMLTDDEALAVTLSLIAARRSGISADAAAIEGVLAKIERVLPEALRSRVQAVQEVVAFQSAPAAPQPESAIVMAISTAAQQRRRVQLRYRSHGDETERRFDSYGLVVHWERWYTVGWCHLRQAVRVFRLDRVISADLVTETFTRPPDFDSLKHVLESLAMAPWGWPVEVLLETTLVEAQRRIPPGNAFLEQTPQGVVVSAQVDRLEWLARSLMTLECPFVIRRPPELRAALRQLAAEAAAMAEREETPI